MVLDRRDVLASAQPLVDLFVLDAVVVLEEQEEIRRGREDGVASCVRATPDLLDDVFGIRAPEEVKDVEPCDQVECIPVLEVLLQEQVPHLLLPAHLAHVLCHQPLDLFPDVPAPNLQLLELVPGQLKDLDEDAASLDDVEVADEEIELVGLQALLLDVVKELPGVP